MQSSGSDDDRGDEEAAMLPRRGGRVRPVRRDAAKVRGCRRPRRLCAITSVAGCCCVALFIAFVVALPSSALRTAARGWHGNDPAAYFAALNAQLHQASTANATGSLCVIRATNGFLDAAWDPRLSCAKDALADGRPSALSPPRARVVTVLDELALSDGVVTTALSAGLHLTVIFEVVQMHWPDSLKSKMVALGDFVQKLDNAGLGDTIVVFVDAFDTLVASDRASPDAVVDVFRALEAAQPADLESATQPTTTGECVAWRSQEGCTRDGARTPQLDESCAWRVPADAHVAGYCECAPDDAAARNEAQSRRGPPPRTAYSTCVHIRLGEYSCSERCAALGAMQRRHSVARDAGRVATNGSCVGWRATALCDWAGDRVPERDAGCETRIDRRAETADRRGTAGYCACSGGAATAHRGCHAGEPITWDSDAKVDESFTCAEQCAALGAKQGAKKKSQASLRESIFFGGEAWCFPSTAMGSPYPEWARVSAQPQCQAKGLTCLNSGVFAGRARSLSTLLGNPSELPETMAWSDQYWCVDFIYTVIFHANPADNLT